MSMPPAGVAGEMDDEAVIQAEIEFELNNIDLNVDQDDGLDDNLDDTGEQIQDAYELDVAGELGDYIKRIQEQTANFEKELEECDELISHTDRPVDKGTSGAVIPYEDYNLLAQLAKESGCDIDQYKQKIFLEIEQDEDILHDDLADFIEDESTVLKPSQDKDRQTKEDGEAVLAVKENGETYNQSLHSAGLPVAIEKAVEDGIDPSEVPVSRELVPTDKRVEIQQMLRAQLDRLEERYRERKERIKKEEAFKRNEEDVRQRRTEEERQWKKQEIEKEERKLKEEREVALKQIEKEQQEMERQMKEEMKHFEEEMTQLQAETDRQKKELEQARKDEENRQLEKQEEAALKIQRTYKGYRVRKEYRPVLEERREERRKVKEEQRIKEVEVEIEEREKCKKEAKEQETLRIEEEKREKEEEKKRKEEEKRQKEEEKRRKKEEEERLRQEEKRKKEEEKRRKKEEEKKRKEEEAERKKEEKRKREEEEKRKKEEERIRKEEEKRKKEEEKVRQEDEKRLKEEERKRKEAEEQRLKEEKKLKEDEAEKQKEEAIQKSNEIDIKTVKDKETSNKTEKTDNVNSSSELKSDKSDKSVSGLKIALNNVHDIKKTDKTIEKNTQEIVTSENKIKPDAVRADDKNMDKVYSDLKNVNTVGKDQFVSDDKQSKTPRSPRTPRPPQSPRKKQVKDVQKSTEKGSVENGQAKPAGPVDCLPEPLEAMRLAFIKDCMPWSKISNEPWKLKGVTSRKPLRRPSSAKKLPLLTADIILQAARVASLKQVTTVQLSDLPGNNISPLGQCWGLKYLELTNCNLKVIEGLQQCKQLQYVNVKDNKIEYVDLKDIGSLQVLNMSHNCLSTIHGLDNCTNLRWLDVSYNNITRLGGLETLRRLHTLKLSHNQMISTKGLGDTPTIQVLDVSSNHLPSLEELDKLCLLLSLNVSCNNILTVPSLKNQVLLSELSLTDNSITSLEELSRSWLPLLQKVDLSQNSIVEPDCLQNCLLLRELDISSNQLLDADVVLKCVEKCLYLVNLCLDENPVLEEVDDSFYEKLHSILPRLQISHAGSPRKYQPLKPRNSFEAMCLSQSQVYKDMFVHLEQEVRLQKEKSGDLAHKCDSYFKFCDKTFKLAVEHRYAHEYGEVSVTMPTAPITPRSGRPNSARKVLQKGDTFTSPKDLFEKALQGSDKTFVVSKSSHSRENSAKEPNILMSSAYSNPKDLFEQALKSGADNRNSSNSVNSQTAQKGALNSIKTPGLTNGLPPLDKLGKSSDKKTAAAITIQAAWRGWLVRHEISQQSKIWLSAITIQAAWRGYCVRKWYRAVIEKKRSIAQIDPELVEKLHKAATTIQAAWRGYSLRSKLLAALEYARFEDDDDGMDLNGDEFDIDKFMDFDEALIDTEWRPPSTPDIPANHPILKKPPSGRPKIPPINTGERPPSNPRRAWKNLESPMSDIQNPLGRIPRPPSSVSSGVDTHRTGLSKKEEKLSEEWGFKDSSTAHLMMQRAKKMKYNAERKKKISKLDPKQRLRLFRKLQEVTHHDEHVQVPQRKTLPRKEYFQARHDELVQQQREKQEEYNTRASRIYEWLHMPVNNYPVTDSVINQGLNQALRSGSESNLPDVQAGRRVQLVSGPGSIELQSVDSMSTAGEQRRRFSAGSSYSATSKLPPIQTGSAPTVKVKERMSWRTAKVNQSVGWGGGKKRGERP